MPDMKATSAALACAAAGVVHAATTASKAPVAFTYGNRLCTPAPLPIIRSKIPGHAPRVVAADPATESSIRSWRSTGSASPTHDDQRAGDNGEDRHDRAEAREAETHNLDEAVDEEPNTQEQETEILFHEAPYEEVGVGRAVTGAASVASRLLASGHHAVRRCACT